MNAPMSAVADVFAGGSLLPPTAVFAHALRGETTYLLGVGAGPTRLPVEDWTRPADAADRALVALCEGPTLDIGCGPGRLTAELGLRGHLALGIDLVHEAVRQTIRRGVSALRRDVFGPVPGEGRWQSALLADGNVGIGGDPVALLARVRHLLAPGGRAVVEVAPPGTRSGRLSARLACECGSSEPFPWAVVGADRLAVLADAAGLVEIERVSFGHRWATVLEEPR